MDFKQYDRNDLINEINRLRQNLKEQTAHTEDVRRKCSRQQDELKERNKELKGIYQITQLINNPEKPVSSVLQKSIEILANSYLYPVNSCGRLSWNNQVYITKGFIETRWKQQAEIDLSGNNGVLAVEIFYTRELPEGDEGPFLDEEQRLLDAASQELAVFLDRRIAEQQITLNTQKLISIFNSVQDAVFIHDLEGNFLEVNKEACRRLNYSRKELLSLTPMDIDEKSYAERAPRIFKKLDKHGQYKGETLHITKDGKKIPTELNSNKISFDGKEAILTVARDITERKEYEKELIEAKNKAEESNRLKSSFLANLSHEIRTPLNVILGFTDLLDQEEPVDAKKKKDFLQNIKNSGNSLLSIINDILDISFIESNQVQTDHQAFSVGDLLDQVSSKARAEIETSHKDLALKINKELKDEDDVVYSDPQMIHKIYEKLLDNALKFTENGYIEIGCRPADKGNIEFWVSDSGIGVPEDLRDLIFERFRQAEDGITRQYEGLGLGLSIAKGYVDRLEGKIAFHSKEGEGSTVRFILPVQKSDDETREPEENSLSAGHLSGQTILIAEDDFPNYSLMKEFLAMTDVKIRYAENGAHAVELFREGGVDLILMDIKMPVLDGIEACKKIKESSPSVPVIALTAYAYENDKKRFLARGFDGYLSKPVEQEELIQKVEAVLSEKNTTL
jgi:PAS domain S-box-containing protein